MIFIQNRQNVLVDKYKEQQKCFLEIKFSDVVVLYE